LVHVEQDTTVNTCIRAICQALRDWSNARAIARFNDAIGSISKSAYISSALSVYNELLQNIICSNQHIIAAII